MSHWVSPTGVIMESSQFYFKIQEGLHQSAGADICIMNERGVHVLIIKYIYNAHSFTFPPNTSYQMVYPWFFPF